MRYENYDPEEEPEMKHILVILAIMIAFILLLKYCPYLQLLFGP